jgi:hypothetical protein
VRDGSSVAFTGFPLGTALGFYPVTHRGIVASHAPVALPAPNAATLDGRVIQGIKANPFLLFQLDATTFPGHSGSPLYDGASGEVVGIVNMGFLKGTKDTAVGQPSGISFAAHHTCRSSAASLGASAEARQPRKRLRFRVVAEFPVPVPTRVIVPARIAQPISAFRVSPGVRLDGDDDRRSRSRRRGAPRIRRRRPGRVRPRAVHEERRGRITSARDFAGAAVVTKRSG